MSPPLPLSLSRSPVAPSDVAQRPTVPPFTPHRLIRRGHAQTLAGFVLRGEPIAERAAQHEVPLEDGDRIVLHDDRPADWRDGGPVVLL